MNRWQTCAHCGQKYYRYVDARTPPETGYCSLRCEREASAARYDTIANAFFGAD